MRIIFLGFFFSALMGAQGEVPADSLLKSSQINFVKKTAIYPIKLWQEMSYSSSHLGCQFEPSCSQYMALSIADYGVLRGVVVGSDRLLRCNPSALTHHLESGTPEFTTDGRMIDILGVNTSGHPAKNPQLACALSIIPGLGRAYAGHGFDGFISFTLISSFGTLSYNGFQSGGQILPSVYGVVALTFWLADFYGAFRSAVQSKD